jgi:hypothetical protein
VSWHCSCIYTAKAYTAALDMQKSELLEYLKAQRLAVQASVSAAGAPQAAVIGIVVSDDFEVFFDTERSTRKFRNLAANSKIALVMGWDDECTAQYEGIADLPSGAELARLKQLYFQRFPDGRERERWPGIAYVRTRPSWIRYSDFRTTPPTIVEFSSFGKEPRT